ncbi:S1 RNA-binding domain-containing protein [Pontibacter silvestris]|uniref:S1 RNA-binding domain-containing protein n=1 Tax=Pontibacter silvestris TaxID=2305183 RepID=A0ABW4WZM2_9BACT|nr:S1-like domain-containing RNA-binding protein [Pontibacter silvestris]
MQNILNQRNNTMVELGNYNELEIAREVDFGVYLASEDGDILLPNKYIPEDAKIGDKLRVFIYRDSEDRMIATTLEPYATVGEFACLTCKDVTPFGAFLEWGLEKDLLVPLHNQKDKMNVGRKYCVYLYLDETSDRVVATSKLGKYLQNENIQLTVGQEAALMVAGFTDIGIKVIIDGKYMGMLFKNEVFQDVRLGDRLTGYIKNIREDNKVDVSLRKPDTTAKTEVTDASQKILDKLQNQPSGRLPLSDNSSPEEIYLAFGMSKKTFKKAIGTLYKNGQIQLAEDHIRLASR